ncbi:MAG: hypothetical protein ACI4CT_08010, partial [Lachnospiraceae bacterium]
MKKRILSILLCIIMLCNSNSVNIYAYAEESVEDEIVQSEIMETEESEVLMATSSAQEDEIGQLWTVTAGYHPDLSGIMPLDADEDALSNYLASLTPNYMNQTINDRFRNSNSDVSVSTFTGGAHIDATDLSLPGKNGLDLTISRFYQSEDSQLGFRVPGETKRGVKQTSYLSRRFNLGLGWSFGFPSVEKVHDNSGDTSDIIYYHDGTGGQYKYNYSVYPTESDPERYSTRLEGYYTDNVTFHAEDTSYTREGYQSQYSFKDSNNTMEYFGSEGELIAIKDRLGNEITYDYEKMPAENLVPYDSYDRYSWYPYQFSDQGDYIKWTRESNSLYRYGDLYTSIEALDPDIDDYYYSLYYTAVDENNLAFSGTVSVSYVLLDKDKNEIGTEEYSLTSFTPDTYNTREHIEGQININRDEFEEGEKPEYIKLGIHVRLADNTIRFEDIRLSPMRSMLSKITDTLGRTVTFTYEDTLHDRDSEDYLDKMTLTVKDAEGNHIRDIVYRREKLVVDFDMMHPYYVMHENVYNYLLTSCDNGEFVNHYEYSGHRFLEEINKGGLDNSWFYTDNSPLLSKIENRNSYDYIEYYFIGTIKWTSNGCATQHRVLRTYRKDKSTDETDYGEYMVKSYSYEDGDVYKDETAYIVNGFYDGLDPTYGYYICTVSNENGSIDKYYYQNEVDEAGSLPKVRGKSKLALLKKETHYENNFAGCDGTTIEYTYDDSYAVSSPSRIKTTERIDGVERVYYNDYAYDEECSLLK